MSRDKDASRSTAILPTDSRAVPEPASASIIRTLATYGFAFLLGFLLSVWTAPGKIEAAFLGGFLLTAGVVAARYALEIVMLPVVLFAWLAGLLFGRKKKRSRDGNSWDVRMAATVFVLAYLGITLISGGVIGAFPGGFGIFNSALLFGAAGLVYALMIRRIAVHELTTEASDSPVADPNEPSEEIPVVTELSRRVAEKMRRAE